MQIYANYRKTINFCRIKIILRCRTASIWDNRIQVDMVIQDNKINNRTHMQDKTAHNLPVIPNTVSEDKLTSEFIIYNLQLCYILLKNS